MSTCKRRLHAQHRKHAKQVDTNNRRRGSRSAAVSMHGRAHGAPYWMEPRAERVTGLPQRGNGPRPRHSLCCATITVSRCDSLPTHSFTASTVGVPALQDAGPTWKMTVKSSKCLAPSSKAQASCFPFGRALPKVSARFSPVRRHSRVARIGLRKTSGSLLTAYLPLGGRLRVRSSA